MFHAPSQGNCPPEIADQLRSGWPDVCQIYPEATLAIAEVENFAKITSELHPTQLVALFNRVQRTIDEAICGSSRIYKVDAHGHQREYT